MPATDKLQVEIVSHEGRLWHGSASQVSFPATDGSIGVLPGRQPVLAGLVPGRVSITTEQDVSERCAGLNCPHTLIFFRRFSWLC